LYGILIGYLEMRTVAMMTVVRITSVMMRAQILSIIVKVWEIFSRLM
jgi:hypothetical protein